MNEKLLFLSLFLIINLSNAFKTYEGYKVFSLNPRTNDQVHIIHDMKDDGVVELCDDDFGINYDVKAMVSKDNLVEFQNRTETAKIRLKEIIGDLKPVVENQYSRKKGSGSGGSSFKPSFGGGSAGRPSAGSHTAAFWRYRRYRHRNTNNGQDLLTLLSMTWDRYYDLQHIYNWIDELQTEFSDIVTTVVMGKSFEGRDIKGVKLNFNPNANNTKIAVIEGTIHAREWISSATVMWIIKEFLTNPNEEIVRLAENFEWHIFPVVNPDGYFYTFTTNRMWRKNRNTAYSIECNGTDNDMSNGVDLNRNFDYMWMVAGASSDPCSNTFAGPSGASEPETMAITQYVRNLDAQGDLIYYLAFHSYSQLVIIPYSHVSGTDVLEAENYADMYEIAIRAADKLEERNGTHYRVGVSGDVMYPMSGTSFDWVKNETNVPISYLFELRDVGEYGFLLPREQIIPTTLEIMDFLVEMDNTAKELKYYSGGIVTVSSITIVMLSVMVYIVNFNLN